MDESKITFTTQQTETADILLNFLLAQSGGQVSREQIMAPNRGNQLVCDFRYVYFNLLKDIFSHFSQKKIGELVGGRDHSTVISGLKKNPLTPQKYKELLELFRSLDGTQKERYLLAVIDKPAKIELTFGVPEKKVKTEVAPEEGVNKGENGPVAVFRAVAAEMQPNSDFFGSSEMFLDSLASGFETFLEENFVRSMSDAVDTYLSQKLRNLPSVERSDFLNRFLMAEPVY